MIRIAVDAERCTGHGRCYDLAPTVFGADEYGHSFVLAADDWGPAQLEDARLAQAACPEQAVSVDS